MCCVGLDDRFEPDRHVEGCCGRVESPEPDAVEADRGELQACCDKATPDSAASVIGCDVEVPQSSDGWVVEEWINVQPAHSDHQRVQ